MNNNVVAFASLKDHLHAKISLMYSGIYTDYSA